MSVATEVQRLQTAKEKIKTAIENKGVTVGDGTIDTYAEKIDEIVSGDYDQGYEDGKNSVARLEKFVKTMRFYNLNDFGTKDVTIEFEKANNFRQMFSITPSAANPDYFVTNTTVEHLTIRTKAFVDDMYQMFYCDGNADATLKRITFDFELDTTRNINMNNIFRHMGGVEVIDGKPLNVSKSASFSGTFNGVGNLKEIRFVENTIKANISFSVCSDLSSETIQSIIDGLADLSSGLSQTLTLHADVGAKLTDEQKANITVKNWTLVY